MEIRVTSVFAQVGESPFFTATGVAVRRAGARRDAAGVIRSRRWVARPLWVPPRIAAAYESECAAGGRGSVILEAHVPSAQRSGPLSPPGFARRGVRERVCGRRPRERNSRSARAQRAALGPAQPAGLCPPRRTKASVRPEAEGA